MEEAFIALGTGVLALLNHIKIEKWAEKHELASALLGVADENMAEITPCVTHSRISEHKETAVFYKNHCTTWGQNNTTWVDYVTTTLKTNHIFWRYVYKIPASSAERSNTDYEQLMANGCNPKLLANQSHFKTLKHSAAMLELERRIGNSSERHR